MLSERQKWFALILLTSAYTLSFVDRIMFAMLMQAIKDDIHLSDTQLGFLTGIVFAIFYAALGIPIGRWADRGDRVSIVSIALVLWGTMVAYCGMVSNFVQLSIARIGGAVGEAGVMPPAYSLIGDYFPPAQRLKAMSIFMSGASVSIAFSYMFAGWMNDHYSWREAFFVMAVPGLILAIVIKFMLPEPRKQQAKDEDAAEQVPLWQGFKILWQQRSFRYLVMALTLNNFVGLGLGQWMATHFIRSYQVTTSELGLWLGLICGGCGGIATLGGGMLFDRYLGNDPRRQLIWISVIVSLTAPIYWVMLSSSTKVFAFLLMIPLQMQILFFYGPVLAMIQQLVATRMRALAIAVTLLIMNLVGLGLGPQTVGILSDLMTPAFGTGGALSVSMAIAATVALGSAYFFWAASRRIDADLVNRQELHADIDGASDPVAGTTFESGSRKSAKDAIEAS